MRSTTSIPNFRIEQTTAQDVPLILSFIKELAEYERLSHEVVATEELLHASLFGERAMAEVLIAYDEHEAVGFALFFHNFSTFLGRPGIYLEDLYVRPAFRRRGLARKMLATLARECVENGYTRLSWAVLDWNVNAIALYDAVGGKPQQEWITYRVSGSELSALADES